MSVIKFKNHNEEFVRSCPLCDVIEVDGQLYVHISKVEVFQNQLQQKENIIKEVREILRKHICNPSGLKNGWHIDCWNNEDISKLNEDLGILDKEVN